MVSARLRRARGYTLPEVLTVMAIFAAMSAVAWPGLSKLVDSQRVRSASSDLFTALLRARSEAVSRNTEITIKPVTAGAWQDGWSIPDPANTAVYFLRHEAVPKATISGPASVVYLGNGRIKGAVAPSFDVSIPGQDKRRCIKLDLSGRPTVMNKAC